MTRRRTRLGDVVTTECVIQSNGTYTENITIECPGVELVLVPEDRSTMEILIQDKRKEIRS